MNIKELQLINSKKINIDVVKNVAKELNVTYSELDILINILKNIEYNNKLKSLFSNINFRNQDSNTIYKFNHDDKIDRLLKTSLLKSNYEKINEILNEDFNIDDLEMILNDFDNSYSEIIERHISKLNTSSSIDDISENTSKNDTSTNMDINRFRHLVEAYYIRTNSIDMCVNTLKYPFTLLTIIILSIINKVNIENELSKELELIDRINLFYSLYNINRIKFEEYIINLYNIFNKKLVSKNTEDSFISDVYSSDIDDSSMVFTIAEENTFLRYVFNIFTYNDSSNELTNDDIKLIAICSINSHYSSLLKLIYASCNASCNASSDASSDASSFVLPSEDKIDIALKSEQKIRLDNIQKVLEDNYKDITSKIEAIECIKQDADITNIYAVMNDYKDVIIKKIEQVSNDEIEKITKENIYNFEVLGSKAKNMYEKSSIKNQISINDDEFLTKVIDNIIHNNNIKTILYDIKRINSVEKLLSISYDYTKNTITTKKYKNYTNDINNYNKLTKSKQNNLKRLTISLFNEVTILNIIVNYITVKIIKSNKLNTNQLKRLLIRFTKVYYQGFNSNTLCKLLSYRYTKNILERNKFQRLLGIQPIKDFEDAYDKYAKIHNNIEFYDEYINYINEIFTYDDGISKIKIESDNKYLGYDLNKDDIKLKINKPTELTNDLLNKLLYDRTSSSIIYDTNKSYDKKFVLYSLIDNNNILYNEHGYIQLDSQSKDAINMLSFLSNSLINNYECDRMLIMKINHALNMNNITSASVDINDYNKYGKIYEDDYLYNAYNMRYIIDFVFNHQSQFDIKTIAIMVWNILCLYTLIYEHKITVHMFISYKHPILDCLVKLINSTNEIKYKRYYKDVLSYELKDYDINNYKIIYDIIKNNYALMNDELHSLKIFDKFSYKSFDKYMSYDDYKRTITINSKIFDNIKNYKIFNVYVLEKDKFRLGCARESSIHICRIILIYLFNYIFEIKLKKYLKNNPNKLFPVNLITSHTLNEYDSSITIAYEHNDNNFIGRIMDPDFKDFEVVNKFLYTFFIRYASKDDINIDNIFHAVKHMSAGNVKNNVLKIILLVMLILILIITISVCVCKSKSFENAYEKHLSFDI